MELAVVKRSLPMLGVVVGSGLLALAWLSNAGPAPPNRSAP